jgi:hypothetical protein
MHVSCVVVMQNQLFQVVKAATSGQRVECEATCRDRQTNLREGRGFGGVRTLWVGSTQRLWVVWRTGWLSMHFTSASSGWGVLLLPSAGRHSAWFSHPSHARTPHAT